MDREIRPLCEVHTLDDTTAAVRVKAGKARACGDCWRRANAELRAHEALTVAADSILAESEVELGEAL